MAARQDVRGEARARGERGHGRERRPPRRGCQPRRSRGAGPPSLNRASWPTAEKLTNANGIHAIQWVSFEALAAFAAIGDAKSTQTRSVRRALELLRARLGEAITLDDLATHAGLDKYHLCRAFRAQVGMPPHAYLTHLRIVRAKELLAAGTKPRDVAPLVGLYDQSQLNRHFRRIVGTTPGRYARSV